MLEEFIRTKPKFSRRLVALFNTPAQAYRSTLLQQVLGIDVSTWQGYINWLMAYNAGARFAFIRACSINYSTGVSYKDYRFDQNKATAPEHVLTGFYAYTRMEFDPVAQARYFAGLIKHVPDWYLPPVMDIEENRRGLSIPTFRSRVRDYVTALQDELGVKPILYTRSSFINPAVGDWDWLGENTHLWNARWDTNPLLTHPWGDGRFIALPWDQLPLGTQWRYWQREGDGNFKGAQYGMQSYHLDIDYFNGDMAGLQAFVDEFGYGSYTPPPPPPGADLQVEITASALNVRSGPTTGYPVVRAVRRLDRVGVYDEHGGWIKISPNTEEWCSGRYTKSLNR